jgi:hypothetical protein
VQRVNTNNVSRKDLITKSHRKIFSWTAAISLLVAVFAPTTPAWAQERQIAGLIVARNGDTTTVKTPDSETLDVALTDDTRVEEVQGLLKLRRKHLGVVALVPGLLVQLTSSHG